MQLTELKAGMKVKGSISFHRSYGRSGIKEIVGVVTMHEGELKVNSSTEPQKYYKLWRFKHNFLTNPDEIFLERR